MIYYNYTGIGSELKYQQVISKQKTEERLSSSKPIIVVGLSEHCSRFLNLVNCSGAANLGCSVVILRRFKHVLLLKKT